MTAAPQTQPQPRHYTFGPREPGGLILGQSGGQLLLTATLLGMFLTVLTPGLGLAARAVRAVVDAAPVDPVDVGDDEAQVGADAVALGLSDDGARVIP